MLRIFILILISVLSGVCSYANAVADSDRQEFRGLLTQLSTISQSSPLQCEERQNQGAPVRVQYTLTLESEPRYRDAYFIRFKTVDLSKDWSTLIAYEGYKGYVMGTLTKKQSGSRIEYQHLFRGFYEDSLGLTVEQGKVMLLSYKKTSPVGIYYGLNCVF
jgi:hypothetical protein